jgi:hypothetical protein
VLKSSDLIGASVKLGAVDFAIADPVVDAHVPAAGGTVVADRKRAIVHVAGVATFGVVEGARVVVDPEPGVEPGALELWLHGTVTALLLAQRGQFALHASVVLVDGQAVALAGARGAGKSSTALRLSQRGHPLVTDDVTPLGGPDGVTAHPFPRRIRVAPDTAHALGLDITGARPMLPRYPKLALPPPSARPVRVRAVAVLSRNGDEAVVAARVRGARAQQLVWQSAYRVQLLWRLWEHELFAWSGALAGAARVYEIERPADGWTVDAVADAVERVAAEDASAD